VATRALARPDARVLTVLGAGVQARSHVDTVSRVRELAEVRVASRSPEHAQTLADEIGGTPYASFEKAVDGADIVCACTDAGRPILSAEWLAPGIHLTSVGASREGPELDPAVMSRGLLVVESRVAFEPYPAGAHELQGLDPESAAELGEILAGTREGRSFPEQITVYKSMGHAVEDAAAAGLVYRRALEDGVGTEVEL
jgi:ornithine cyclodeaminase/alanine dehydrogenase-like protein (mu-crystallin family)